ncbi:4Fe-4S ferredoxin iron-sulfur binding domain protein [Desulfofarcimen acetoxidans DSM 771]|uniref:4Fe-4S ferredoxin iron-sulfur binding domain protein n=1 Tax=Desulfofarcimen acetoxidans (strain ATCC 49208 / DSM 771 / KCTC 5769 / VKM B-1644 / 5575) TaxID=485916 RepID=C8W6E3_DESAS|nr:4Fe-4S dicluster domain-containing protein [Desulfofarcimen acetoxidans]ACV62232.1 4Fe-4S ferredoxin iron-sulfur binding domain protein [Desulfofarcimen acetoxidans DSM 771]
MNNITLELRKQARKLLEDQVVQLVIGYGRGSDPFRVTPVFVRHPDFVDSLIWNPFCINNLAKYLIEYRYLPGKIAVVIKGCDSRAVNRLIQDNQIERDKIVLLGVPCTGILEAEKVAKTTGYQLELERCSEQEEKFTLHTSSGDFSFAAKDSLITKCYSCYNHNPVVFDIMLGPAAKENPAAVKYSEVESLEKLNVKEKSEYWDMYFSRCLRCYACRNVCTACTCQECIFNQAKPAWVDRINNLSNNTSFHLIRAFHVAGRCVDCGECDRVCPVNIPLRHLNQKILKDLQELYDAPIPGADLETGPALGCFVTEDPEEFM